MSDFTGHFRQGLAHLVRIVVNTAGDDERNGTASAVAALFQWAFSMTLSRRRRHGTIADGRVVRCQPYDRSMSPSPSRTLAGDAVMRPRCGISPLARSPCPVIIAAASISSLSLFTTLTSRKSVNDSVSRTPGRHARLFRLLEVGRAGKLISLPSYFTPCSAR